MLHDTCCLTHVCRPKNIYFCLTHYFYHLVTCCVPCSITDSEAVLNCVVPNPGNSNWQPHTSLFTSRQQLSLLIEVSSPDVCNSRCWRFGGIRNRVSQLSSATQLARRPTAVHQTLGRTEAGCPESRTIKDLRTEKFVPEIAYKLVTAVDSREKTAPTGERDHRNLPNPQKER